MTREKYLVGGAFEAHKTWSADPFHISALNASNDPREVQGVTKSDGIILVQANYLVEGSYGGRRKKPVIFSNGDFTFYQAGTPHHTQSKAHGPSLAIEFDSGLRRQLVRDLNLSVNLDEPRTATGGLKNGFAHTAMLAAFLKDEASSTPLKAQCLLTLLLSDLSATLENKPDQPCANAINDAAIRTVRDFIDTHVDEKIQIDQLAALVGISPFHFARKFKEATGTSPHQFVIQHRIEKVQAMLGNPRLSLADIAFATGFSSQSHMSTQFKKSIGVTPAAYRKITLA